MASTDHLGRTLTPQQRAWYAHQAYRARYHHWLATSPDWQVTLRRLRQRADYRCELCGTDAVPGVGHHLRYDLGWIPPLRWILLCCDFCHDRLHSRYPYRLFEG